MARRRPFQLAGVSLDTGEAAPRRDRRRRSPSRSRIERFPGSPPRARRRSRDPDRRRLEMGATSFLLAGVGTVACSGFLRSLGIPLFDRRRASSGARGRQGIRGHVAYGLGRGKARHLCYPGDRKLRDRTGPFVRPLRGSRHRRDFARERQRSTGSDAAVRRGRADPRDWRRARERSHTPSPRRRRIEPPLKRATRSWTAPATGSTLPGHGARGGGTVLEVPLSSRMASRPMRLDELAKVFPRQTPRRASG